ncbi:hypothetical protein [Helicobacter cetorum]|uniref:hypothetical protein n=1 Tax=Helicobacter cetorum TaxID=138563 RepID=UPI0013156417|nr:hypothetical protein [Helicobacter cetorum]
MEIKKEIKSVCFEENLKNVPSQVFFIYVPCKVYELEVQATYGLNIFEKTILKLIQIDRSLENDTTQLAYKMGLYDYDDPSKDKREFVKMILVRLREKGVNFYSNEPLKIPQTRYLYEEQLSQHFLPIASEPSNTRKISLNTSEPLCENSEFKVFETKIKDEKDKDIASYVITPNLSNNKELSNRELEKNFKQIYKESDIEILSVSLKDTIYVRLQLFFYDNDNTFRITNGYSKDYARFLENYFKESGLISALKSKNRQENQQNSQRLDLPFENKIYDYSEIAQAVGGIEELNREIELSDEDLQEKYRNIATLYFKILERVLSYMVEDKFQELENNRLLQGKLRLKSHLDKLARGYGFEMYSLLDKLLILNADKTKNIQQYVALLLLEYNKECKELAKLFPKMIEILNELLKIRNKDSHAKSTTNQPLEITQEQMKEYRECAYEMFSLIYEVRRKDTLEQNSYNPFYQKNQAKEECLEEYHKIFSKKEREVLEKRVPHFYPAFEKIIVCSKKYDENNKIVMSMQIISEWCKIFEEILRNLLPRKIERPLNFKANEMLDKNLKLPMRLKDVRPEKIKHVFDKKHSTLGAYCIVFMYANKPQRELLELIDNLLEERSHLELRQDFVEKEKLEHIKTESLKWIKNLMKE